MSLSEREVLPPGVEPLLEVEPVPVEVLFECRETGNDWQPRIWRPSRVEPGTVESPIAVQLHVDEAEGYYLNVTTDEPSLFVQWRLAEDDTGIVADGDPTPPRALAVTASYNEAGRWMDGGARVDRVPMPQPMQRWVAEYVSLHYVPERARKRTKVRPSFMQPPEFAAMVERERARMKENAREGGAERDAERAVGQQAGREATRGKREP